METTQSNQTHPAGQPGGQPSSANPHDRDSFHADAQRHVHPLGMIPALDALIRVYDNLNLEPQIQRVELRKMQNGHWRCYLACVPNTHPEWGAKVQDVLAAEPITVNLFRKAKVLVSVQLVSDAEQ